MQNDTGNNDNAGGSDKVILSRKAAVTIREWLLDDPAMDSAPADSSIVAAQSELDGAIEIAYEALDARLDAEASE